jgi:hypothetical protein
MRIEEVRRMSAAVTVSGKRGRKVRHRTGDSRRRLRRFQHHLVRVAKRWRWLLPLLVPFADHLARAVFGV